MGKRYYCEYCERAFQDNLIARKKHLTSGAHLRNKLSWYAKFRDKKQILEDNINKKPCHKFMSTGECPFGNNCKYRHLTDKEIQEIQEENSSSTLPPNETLLKSWSAKVQKRIAKPKEDNKADSSSEEEPEVEYNLPSGVDLPPSLQPPPPQGWRIKCEDIEEWG